MSAIQINKLGITPVPVEFQKEEGCIAFEKVEFSYFFYGSQQKDVLDTKILPDGSQIVISGNGFIKDGFQIN